MAARFQTLLRSVFPALLALAGGAWAVEAQAQAALKPLTADSVQAGLQRAPGAAVQAPRLLGGISLQDRRYYIAEYQVLVEIGGELTMPQVDGTVLGLAVNTPSALVDWRSQPDVQALQMLVDHGWADLRARLQAAGLPQMSAKELLGVTPTVYEATVSASTPDKPVTATVTIADRVHRYLVLSPTGMPVVRHSGTGLDPGNVLARLTHVSQKIEALSFGIAFNLGGQDPAGTRPSPYVVSESASAPAAMSQAAAPWLEVASVPELPLIGTHVQGNTVRLAEALTLKPEFGRLLGIEAAPAEKRAAPPEALAGAFSAARSLGQRVGLVGAEPVAKVNAVLELDGPGLSRGLVYGLFSANQAIVNAMLAAR